LHDVTRAHAPRVVALALVFLSACRKTTEETSMEGMEGQIMGLAQSAMSLAPLIPSILFVVVGYFFILLDRREDRPSKDDKQVGSKLVLWGFIMAGIGMVAGGADSIVQYVLGGFKGGFAPIKGPLSALISGVAIAGAFGLLFLPRTNNATATQVERYAMGFLALTFGLQAIAAFSGLVGALFQGAGWRGKMGDGYILPGLSTYLAKLAVYGGAAAVFLTRHGAASGWTAPPPRPQMPSPQYPPQGGGYPPQGGGYPPQGGGYPPQGGGYPQQGGGGYPPQGGGYPPQGGGYPPQGGYGR
jgi:hypothetical protein